MIHARLSELNEWLNSWNVGAIYLQARPSFSLLPIGLQLWGRGITKHRCWLVDRRERGLDDVVAVWRSETGRREAERCPVMRCGACVVTCELTWTNHSGRQIWLDGPGKNGESDYTGACLFTKKTLIPMIRWSDAGAACQWNKYNEFTHVSEDQLNRIYTYFCLKSVVR